MREKIAGIIGGMGPEATVDLMARVIRSTPAKDDIDHVHLVVDNNPKVPSRISALVEKNGESPLPCLREMAVKLADWGVDFLAMPCNTAHYYHKDIQEVVNIPLLNMIELTVEALTQENDDLKIVGVLASSAVLNLQLYEKRFNASGIKVLRPSEELQKDIMSAIRKIKTGRYGQEVVRALQDSVDFLINNGAEALLWACTELSIIGHKIKSAVKCYDSAQILAEAIVTYSKKSLTIL